MMIRMMKCGGRVQRREPAKLKEPIQCFQRRGTDILIAKSDPSIPWQSFELPLDVGIRVQPVVHNFAPIGLPLVPDSGDTDSADISNEMHDTQVKVRFTAEVTYHAGRLRSIKEHDPSSYVEYRGR